MSVTVYLWDMSPLVFTNSRHMKAVNNDPESHVEFIKVDAEFGLADDEALYDNGDERVLVLFRQQRDIKNWLADVTLLRPTRILRVYDHHDEVELMIWLRSNGCIDGMLLTPTPWEVAT